MGLIKRVPMDYKFQILDIEKLWALQNHPLYQSFNFQLLSIQNPDHHCQLMMNDTVQAYASLWLQKEEIKVGHFFAADLESGTQLLKHINKYIDTDLNLAHQNLIGPMDANTWFSYRLVLAKTAREKTHSEPEFFLEPKQPDFYQECFKQAGYQLAVEYLSTKVNLLEFKEPKYQTIKTRMNEHQVEIQKLSPEAYLLALPELYDFCCQRFSQNAYFQKLSKLDFFALYQPMSNLINQHFCYLVRSNSAIKGFIFAYVDPIKPSRLIIKTAAMANDRAIAGVSRLIIQDMVNYALHLKTEPKITEVIYALMQSDNQSAKTALKVGQEFRRYGLFKYCRKS